MLRVFAVFLLMAGFAPGFAFAQDARPSGGDVAVFFQTIPDMPLMQGLEELPDQTVIFEKPAGRIIDAAAALEDEALAPADVLTFYKETLPQLGWVPAPKDSGVQGERFVRGGESVMLEVEAHDGHRFLTIAVRPLAPNH
ncbi:MAG: hypothetical protein KDJ75_03820 [Alphaproteobacteria bacterium]|nr:hypothetical protein [Alphaproteobacteria bacterium]